MSEWHIYRADCKKQHNDIVEQGRLPSAPRWRNFQERSEQDTRGTSYRPGAEEVEMVNAALYLRRPLLITGNPGTGKSSLAYSVAWQLNLGDVLWWPINSRSALQEGLYDYDALGRLRDLNIEKLEWERRQQGKEQGHTSQASEAAESLSHAERLGRYIRLGPLGTALYGAGDRPRVLLIDEIDKSDIDLPNDLLHVLEDAAFSIPEIQRLTPNETHGSSSNNSGTATIHVFPHDSDSQQSMLPIQDGKVQCQNFPLVIFTSNGERELPPAFNRRCLRLDIDDPEKDRLREIVMAHIEEAIVPGPDGEAALTQKVDELLETFLKERDTRKKLLATDQFLNAAYLITRVNSASDKELADIRTRLWRALGNK